MKSLFISHNSISNHLHRSSSTMSREKANEKNINSEIELNRFLIQCHPVFAFLPLLLLAVSLSPASIDCRLLAAS